VRFREDHELGPLRDAIDAALPRGAQHQRGLEKIVVSAVRAGADQGLREGDALLRDLSAGKAFPD